MHTTTLQDSSPGREITALRKEGKLQEAFAKARAYMAKNPDNIWARRSMFWVLRDLCSQSLAAKNAKATGRILVYMNKLYTSMQDDSDASEKAMSYLRWQWYNLLPGAETI